MASVSVIVPVYMVQPYLSRCVESILSQTFCDFELILVDDGSSDECGRICDEFGYNDKRIIVIHQVNMGQGAARNVALKQVKLTGGSNYISFIDSDDYVLPQYLEILLRGIKTMKTGICMCSFELFSDSAKDNEIEEPASYSLVDPVSFFTTDGKKLRGYIWGGLYDTRLWQTIAFPEGHKWEDLAIAYRVFSQVDTIAMTNCTLYKYFLNQSGTVYSSWSPMRLDYIWALEELLKDHHIKYNPRVFNITKKTYIYCLREETNKLKQSNYGNQSERLVYQKIYSMKLQKAVKKYGLRQIEPQDRLYVLEAAYPRISAYCWVIFRIYKQRRRVE